MIQHAQRTVSAAEKELRIARSLADDLKRLSCILNEAFKIIEESQKKLPRMSTYSVRANWVSDLEMFESVCLEMGIDPCGVRSRGRSTRLIKDRWAVIERLSNIGWGPSRIGRAVHRDHSAVIHALKQIPRNRIHNAKAGFA